MIGTRPCSCNGNSGGINQVFAKYNLAACIKGGLELQGYAVGAPLPPQPALSPEGIEEVRLALTDLGAL